MRLASASAVLLLVDLQRSFCAEDGVIARQGWDIGACQSAAAACFRLAHLARRRGLPVIWTRMAFRPDYADGGRLVNDLRPNLKRIGALQDGSADADLIPPGAVPGEDVVVKSRYSALYSTRLESLLQARRVDTVIVAGVTTSMCVESTVRDLGQRDYATFVIANACGDFSVQRHEASLAAMSFGFAHLIDETMLDRALRAGGADTASH